MRMRSLLTLVGLAIGFAMPGFALQGDLAGDARALEQFGVLGVKFDQAYKESDATAIAALFTEDAVLVTPEGVFSGRQAIEKYYADLFQQWHPTNNIGETPQLNALGNGAWSVGEWSCTFQAPNGPLQARGYWSAIYVSEGDAWKTRMLTISDAPRPAPPAETK
jgi:uncharacterized protein (TIGR02246 family)